MLRHRAVRHDPADVEPDPNRALGRRADLTGLRLAHDHAVDLGGERRTGEVLGTEHQPFLVDQRGDDDAAGERPGQLQGPGRVDHRRDAGLHVRAAAPVDPPVTQLRAVRVERPRPPVALGDDIGVALEHQRRTGATAAFDHGDDVGASGSDLDNLRVPAEATHRRGDELGRRRLRRPGRRLVDGPQPHKCAGQLDDSLLVDLHLTDPPAHRSDNPRRPVRLVLRHGVSPVTRRRRHQIGRGRPG